MKIQSIFLTFVITKFPLNKFYIILNIFIKRNSFIFLYFFGKVKIKKELKSNKNFKFYEIFELFFIKKYLWHSVILKKKEDDQNILCWSSLFSERFIIALIQDITLSFFIYTTNKVCSKIRHLDY